MSSGINTLRQVLVFGAVIAAVIAAGGGRWFVVAILVPGLLAHFAMSAWLRRGGAFPDHTASVPPASPPQV